MGRRESFYSPWGCKLVIGWKEQYGCLKKNLRTTIVPRTGEDNGNPLQYSCLENPMDGGAWWAAVHGVAKSRTRLSDFTFTFHFSNIMFIF